MEDSIRAAGNKPDPTEVWEAVKRETKAGSKAQQEHREFCRVSYLGAVQTRFQTQKHRETNRMASQVLELALPAPAPLVRSRHLERQGKIVHISIEYIETELFMDSHASLIIQKAGRKTTRRTLSSQKHCRPPGSSKERTKTKETGRK